MSVLVVAEHNNSHLNDATHKAVTAAQALGGEITILVAGSSASAVAQAASKISGVSKVLHAEGDALEKHLAEAMEALIVPLMANYDALVFAATTTGKNIAPRIAAKLDVMQISDVISITGGNTFQRPIYAGNAIATITSSDAKKIMTIRGTAFAPAEDGGNAPIEELSAPSSDKSRFVSEDMVASDRPELTAAKHIVSGGRALGSAEDFDKYMIPLADKLGAAIGASRAAVDAGYAPNDYQVGQTGKIVAPELYIAIGISGAIQHLAGMKDSKIIVAINKDEDAPIFQVADYGLVADLFDVVPKLIEAL